VGHYARDLHPVPGCCRRGLAPVPTSFHAFSCDPSPMRSVRHRSPGAPRVATPESLPASRLRDGPRPSEWFR
jgi:hypothetical protein